MLDQTAGDFFCLGSAERSKIRKPFGTVPLVIEQLQTEEESVALFLLNAEKIAYLPIRHGRMRPQRDRRR